MTYVYAHCAGPFEKLTQVTMILPLTGKQYSEKVSEMCVGVWKAHGTYTDADGATLDKFLEIFKDENFPPGSSILFTTSAVGSLTVSCKMGRARNMSKWVGSLTS